MIPKPQTAERLIVVQVVVGSKNVRVGEVVGSIRSYDYNRARAIDTTPFENPKASKAHEPRDHSYPRCHNLLTQPSEGFWWLWRFAVLIF